MKYLFTRGKQAITHIFSKIKEFFSNKDDVPSIFDPYKKNYYTENGEPTFYLKSCPNREVKSVKDVLVHTKEVVMSGKLYECCDGGIRVELFYQGFLQDRTIILDFQPTADISRTIGAKVTAAGFTVQKIVIEGCKRHGK